MTCIETSGSWWRFRLISEGKMIYGILVFTAVLLIGLMFLTVWSFADLPSLTKTH